MRQRANARDAGHPERLRLSMSLSCAGQVAHIVTLADAAASTLLGAAILSTVATLLSLSRSPHWLFRTCDFPRVQIAVVGGASSALYLTFYYGGRLTEMIVLAATGVAILWQLYKIYPYTPLAPRRVLSADRQVSALRHDPNRFSLLVANVRMENDRHELLINEIRKRDPDVVLAVETDQRWIIALEGGLRDTFPHVVRQPQDNYYGLLLMSRLELLDPEIRFLVQDDVPSVHCEVRLRSGATVRLHGIHPRPPEPIRDQISAPRDAELVLLGREIRDRGEECSVVAGDLNDVAWSRTSELFLRLSGLLDPRIGRGFFNSYNANNPLFRFPLDHVFHSRCFRLVSLQRLGKIDSDHFPLMVELLFDPEAMEQQPRPEKKAADDETAAEIVGREKGAAATGADRPNDDA